METMVFAAKLKLESKCSEEQRTAVINEILNIFDLHKHINTLISQLSGGQRKRICIAIELIDNPSVLFLDEPTTGLDEVSASTCLKLLKKLADCGRTIICSLHCPSARLFQMFDKVYAMSSGQCIYQGTMDHIVPYLQQFELYCPVSYNPTDFIIEVAMKSYGDFHHDLVDKIKNGQISNWLPNSEVESNPIIMESYSRNNFNQYLELKSSNHNSWWDEYKLIYMRFLKQIWRDQTNLRIKLIVHILCALLLGFANVNVSSNAKYSIFNYHFSLIVSIMFFFLTMVPMLASVPHDMKYIRRECFNRWYRLSSYFMALITSQLLMICFTAIIDATLIYLPSGQPMELHRFALFLGVAFATSLMASSFGLLLGARFCELHALFLGPYIMAGMIIMASYPAERDQLTLLGYIVAYGNFVRYPLEGLLDTLLGFGRGDFPCPSTEIMCWSSKPKFILRLAGNVTISYWRSFSVLIGLYVVFCTLAYQVFKLRLGSKHNSTLGLILDKLRCFLRTSSILKSTK
ncbi:ATP-binding cassette sub-family G member 4-like isoform X2 [Haematobia irritans]